MFRKDPNLSDIENFVASIGYENFGMVDDEYVDNVYAFKRMQISFSLSSLNPFTMFNSAKAAATNAFSKVTTVVKSEVTKVLSTLKTEVSSEIKHAESVSTELTSLTSKGGSPYGSISTASKDIQSAEKGIQSIRKSIAVAETDLENPLGAAEAVGTSALSSAEKGAKSLLTSVEKPFEKISPVTNFSILTEQVFKKLKKYNFNILSGIKKYYNVVGSFCDMYSKTRNFTEAR